MQRTTDEILMRRYFLGDLPLEERVRLEDRYLLDVALFEGLLAAENDLIDAYVRGELTEAERQQFEMEYLKSPEGHERLDFARALNQVSVLANEAVPARKNSLWKRMWAALSIRQGIPQWALATAVVVTVACRVVVAGAEPEIASRPAAGPGRQSRGTPRRECSSSTNRRVQRSPQGPGSRESTRFGGRQAGAPDGTGNDAPSNSGYSSRLWRSAEDSRLTANYLVDSITTRFG